MISVVPFRDALVIVINEYPNLKSEHRERRAMVNDLVDGVRISKSRGVEIRDFKRDFLIQTYRNILNEIGNKSILTCLPEDNGLAISTAFVQFNGVIFEIREYAGFRLMRTELTLTWGEK